MEQKTYGLPELTAEIAKQAEVSKKDAERVIKALVSFTKETVGEGNQVRIIGFGTFKKHHAEARAGERIPRRDSRRVHACNGQAEQEQADQRRCGRFCHEK